MSRMREYQNSTVRYILLKCLQPFFIFSMLGVIETVNVCSHSYLSNQLERSQPFDGDVTQTSYMATKFMVF